MGGYEQTRLSNEMAQLLGHQAGAACPGQELHIGEGEQFVLLRKACEHGSVYRVPNDRNKEHPLPHIQHPTLKSWETWQALMSGTSLKACCKSSPS